ncbi:6-phosphogluconolactonase [Hydrogenovibrio sp. JE_KL2]|uniref:6-phosphogluconolactonase n=1 Tax=Hydrogenovibrio sp. JE_KL2 TaxID=2651188 RepID=UPI00128DAB36|nr:6-phosphogluconolactonase [Hydrogenovibrio sp. JE_KL2]MPQ76008.1 6-phosphogluconolactonase [Hydrogenovibrio sp. JE_KL2]
MNTSLPNNWIALQTAEEVAQKVTEQVLLIADESISQKGSFHFITAGGTTPNRCYELLCEAEADWKRWHIYMGDERCYPATNAERNSFALTQHWLGKQKQIPNNQIHFMPTELGLEAASRAYNDIVHAVVGSVGCFDLCLLGMGEDGHTASLFPGHFYIEDQYTVLERQSPKPPNERLSLSFETLCNSKTVIKVVTGASKHPAIQQWLKGENLPISNIYGLENTFTYLSEDALKPL